MAAEPGGESEGGGVRGKEERWQDGCICGIKECL